MGDLARDFGAESSGVEGLKLGDVYHRVRELVMLDQLDTKDKDSVISLIVRPQCRKIYDYRNIQFRSPILAF